MRTRHLIIILLGLILSLPVHAQKNKHKERHAEMRKEFREFKIKFIAQEISLQPEQTKEFTELYSQMEDEKFKVFSSAHKLECSVKANKNATDADYTKLSEAMLNAKEKDAELSKKYDDKFSKVLSPKQLYKMKEAEESFRRKMQEMRRKKSKKK